mmetsp:Transcript_11220/g.17212  ORF Transcript_11220/g.17212 Transcript_11220/m.17212 type:complete len:248 (-) Transcript_11220:55-798(-)
MVVKPLMGKFWTAFILLFYGFQGSDGFSSTRPSTGALSISRPSPLYSAEGNTERNDSDNESTGKITEIKKTSRNLLDRIDTFGMSLKPKAVQAQEKRSTATKKLNKFLYSLQSCGFFTSYIFYRAYRGFFLILPAVFGEVYRKLENAVDNPFTEDSQGGSLDSEKRSLRTRVTVSIVAGVVTLSYMINGAWRVLVKFIITGIKTSSPSSSFSAAADEMQESETIFMEYSKKGGNFRKINGTPDGLAP